MMKRNLFAILLIGLSLKLFSQPGYMGKKYSVGYNFEVFPSLGLFNEKRDVPENELVFTTGHHFNVSAVVGRKSELIFDYGIITPKIFCHAIQLYKEDSWGNLEPVQFNPIEKFVKAKEQVFQLYYRYYYQDYIAPVGNFMQFGIGYLTANYHSDVKAIVGDNSYGDNYFGFEERVVNRIPVTDVPDRKYLRFTYGFGMKRILFENVFISTACNLNLLVGSGNDFTRKDIGMGDFEAEKVEHYYKNEVLLLGVGGAGWLEFNIGIGMIF